MGQQSEKFLFSCEEELATKPQPPPPPSVCGFAVFIFSFCSPCERVSHKESKRLEKVEPGRESLEKVPHLIINSSEFGTRTAHERFRLSGILERSQDFQNGFPITETLDYKLNGHSASQSNRKLSAKTVPDNILPVSAESSTF